MSKEILVDVSIEGVTPLLMHKFSDVEQEKASSGVRSSINGDRGTPREQAVDFLYIHKGKPALPGMNIFRAIIDAGKWHKNGKSKVTTNKSSLVPAAMSILTTDCLIKPEAWEVDSRPVVIPSTAGRIVRHRPRFDEWQCSFTLSVNTQEFSEKFARQLVDDAGMKVGVGDFRPACKGPFGRFKVISWKQKK